MQHVYLFFLLKLCSTCRSRTMLKNEYKYFFPKSASIQLRPSLPRFFSRNFGFLNVSVKEHVVRVYVRFSFCNICCVVSCAAGSDRLRNGSRRTKGISKRTASSLWKTGRVTADVNIAML